jgi:hypothetical protein
MKILKIVLNIIIIFQISIHALFSQVDIHDSLILSQVDRVLQKTSELEELYSKRSIHRQLIDDMIKNFCFLKSNNKIESTKIFSIFVLTDFLKKEDLYKFLAFNASCFESDELDKIRGILNVQFGFKNLYYHNLVSIFALKGQISYLQSHVSDSIFTSIKKSLEKDNFKKYEIEQLKNLATLVNLQVYNEEKYLYEIKKLTAFYQYIMPNSIGILISKNSVISTIYLIDEVEKYRQEGFGDVGDFGYSFNYFLSCIQPKIESSEIELMAWTDFYFHKEKIKNLILNDNKIWKKYIK